MSARVAVVTGAGGSLGRSIACRLASDGFSVALTDVDAGSLAATRTAVADSADRAGRGARVHAAVVDLRDASAITAFFSDIADELGAVTALVNNAAVYPTTAFLEVPASEYDDVVAVNQRGYWLCAQEAARQMTADRSSGVRGGAIVNISSITAHGGWANLASYVSTKGAAVALTRALARELGPEEIRVNAVSPGAFPTAAEEIHPDPAAYNQHVLDQQSLKRRGTPEELAAVVAFLVSDESSFVTGQTIEVNGGWFMS